MTTQINNLSNEKDLLESAVETKEKEQNQMEEDLKNLIQYKTEVEELLD